jgi:5-methyltetrahydrofolate--homocysteine methyltransferase
MCITRMSHSESAEDYIRRTAAERIMIIDGAMGTEIQKKRLTDEQFRGDRFKDHPHELKGNNDLLSITCPEVIYGIHKAYLLAGADFVETNTFNGTSISQKDYHLEEIVYELNKTSAALAKKACLDVEKECPGRRCFVAGAIGPTSVTLSVSPSVENAAIRNSTFAAMVESYKVAVQGLMDGGADVLFVETIFDTLNAKAALFAIDEFFQALGTKRPLLVISGTIVDMSGRTLSGQTTEAFYTSVAHSDPFCVGLNCALGPGQMTPFIQRLSKVSDCLCHAYPNAGLPNAMGGYDETPAQVAAAIREWALSGFVNMVGGCCGTSPAHIAAIAAAVAGIKPRTPSPRPASVMMLSGLEAVNITPAVNFVNIGERCNVAGSIQFKKLIVNGQYDAAIEIAKAQVENGAQVLDFNFDDGMLDGAAAMRRFCNLCVTEPDIAKASPVAAGLVALLLIHDAGAICVRQQQIFYYRGRAAMRTGQVHCELDIFEGRRSRIHRACQEGQALRCCRHRDGF